MLTKPTFSLLESGVLFVGLVAFVLGVGWKLCLDFGFALSHVSRGY
jgi:hypothetical protein